MSAVHVCPTKDIVCGDRPDNWCAACPKWADFLNPGPIHVVPNQWHSSQREEFAKAAMQGILANPHRIGRSSEVCEAAVFYADALIAALNKEPQS